MKLLVYLRFLRPLRSLVFIAISVGMAPDISWGGSAHHLETATALFIVLTVALPLMLGLFIAGAAHEPMHRPFALLLPGIQRRQRAAAGYSMLVAAFATTCVVSWLFPASTATATFGLASTLIALPCLSQHRQPGIISLLAAFFVWALVRVFVGAKLAMAMAAVPWLFFFGGLTISIASLVRGFSRESLRVRTRIPFTSPQTNFCSTLFYGRSGNRMRAEMRAARNPQKADPSAAGRDWTVRSVGADTWSWMRVFSHTVYGPSRRLSPLNLRFSLVFVLAFYAALLPLLGFLGRAPFTISEYWNELANLGALGSGYAYLGPAARPPLLFQAGFCVLFSLGFARPQLAYPIARRRLADVVFGLSLTQLCSALILPALSVFGPCLVGQLVSNHFMPGLGLPSLVALDLGLLPLLPLLACAGAARYSARRILLGAPVAVAIFAVTVTHAMWSRWILSAPGLALVTVATAITLLLLRWRIRHHYRTCDLLDELGSDTLSVHRFGEQN